MIREKNDFDFKSCATCRHSRYDVEINVGVCKGKVIAKNLSRYVCDDWERV